MAGQVVDVLGRMKSSTSTPCSAIACWTRATRPVNSSVVNACRLPVICSTFVSQVWCMKKHWMRPSRTMTRSEASVRFGHAMPEGCLGRRYPPCGRPRSRALPFEKSPIWKMRRSGSSFHRPAASSARTAPTAGPSWNPCPQKPKRVVEAGRSLQTARSRECSSGIRPSMPDHVRMMWAEARRGTSAMAMPRSLGVTSANGRARIVSPVRPSNAGAEDDVSARDLAKIDAATAYAEVRNDEVGQRLGHRHVRGHHLFRHALAKLLGNLRSPGACRVDDASGSKAGRIGETEIELLAIRREAARLPQPPSRWRRALLARGRRPAPQAADWRARPRGRMSRRRRCLPRYG